MIKYFRNWLKKVSHPGLIHWTHISDIVKLSSRYEKRPAAPILPSHRKRRLTLPLPVDQVEPQQVTASQEQSDFFSKLPVDVRLIIYREVFGDREIHVACEYSETKKKWEVWSIECFAPDFLGQGDGCRDRWGGILRNMSPRPYQVTEKYSWTEIEISLLLSCRQA